MPTDDFEYSIARCQVLVNKARERLYRDEWYSLAQDLSDVLNRIAGFRSTLNRSNEEINNLRRQNSNLREENASLQRKYDFEKRAKVNAQQQEQTLLENIKLQQDTIRKHVATITRRNSELKAAELKASDNYGKGYKDGQEAEKNRQNQPVNDSEDLIRSRLASGAKKFKAYDFPGALAVLKEAQKKILDLPASRRPLYDNREFRYQMAICGAYINDLAASEVSLLSFVEGPFSNASGREDMLGLAHAQHLLAQVYIGQNRLQDAHEMWQRSNTMRRAYLPENSNRLSQSRALQAQILQLQKDRFGAELAAEKIQDASVRKALIKAYSKLNPLPAGNEPENVPYMLEEPATELLPIWTMRTKGKRQVTKPDQPQPKDPNTVDPSKRSAWLSSLQLTPLSGKPLDSSLEQAIRSGDIVKVEKLLTPLKASNTRPPAPALHIAALFNEVTIATALLAAGADPTEPCTATHSNGKSLLPGILPMHCAIGAQNVEMIRLLSSKGADFYATTRLPARDKVSAPPLWLVSERWLRMTGKDGADDVVRVLRVLKEKGWRKGDGINPEGSKMSEVVKRNFRNRPALRDEVLRYLKTM